MSDLSRRPTTSNQTEALDPDHLTDLGNARRLVRLFGQDLRHVPAWGRWLVWSGRHWAQDETGQVERFAKHVAASLYSEAGYEDDERRRRELGRHAIASESVRAIRGMVTLAQTEPGIAVAPSALDPDLWLLNVDNGTLDLRTGALRDHRRGDLITKLVPVAYNAAAACPTFETFLRRIFAERPALIDFVQRAVGYSLTGDMREQVIFLCWGTGANGKTTLMQAFASMLADYASTLAADTLLAKKGGSALAMNDLASLQGARFVTAVESDMGRRLAEALVKQVTGGEDLKVKRLYADVFKITPTFKLWVGTNHKPVIRGTDYAIWRRIRLVPFDVVIADEEQDHQLLAKFQAERPGILRWAVEGCLAWQRHGLGLPDEVRRATAAYRIEMDSVGDFLAARCVEEEGTSVASEPLYENYVDWAKRHGETAISHKALSMQLAERGLVGKKTKGGKLWLGLRLRGAMEAAPVTDETSVRGCDGFSGNSFLRARESVSSQKKHHQASSATDPSPETWRESDMFDPPETD